MDETQPIITDQELIKLLQEKELFGLELLVKRFQVKALRTAWLIVQNTAVAEDIVQESFLKIYNSSYRLDPSKTLAPYLNKIVINGALDHLRIDRRFLDFDTFDDVLADNYPWLLQPLTEDEIVLKQTQEEVQNLIKGLSPKQRTVIVMKYYLGMGNDEISQELSSAVGTIKWHLNKAKQRLKLLLEKSRRVNNEDN